MRILKIHSEIQDYLKKHNLEKKFKKQKFLFEYDFRHPSLNTELLEPKAMKIYSFRIDRKYRAIFIFHNRNTIEIIDVNNHYK